MEKPGQYEGSGWVAVRTIFCTTVDANRTYEERVTLWRTDDMDSAIELAEAEAHQYAADLSGPPGFPTQYLGLAQAYLLSDEPSHGAEVFSLTRESQLQPGSYIDKFFDTGTERQQHARG